MDLCAALTYRQSTNKLSDTYQPSYFARLTKVVSMNSSAKQIDRALKQSGADVDVGSLHHVATALDTAVELLAALRIDIPLVSTFVDAISKLSTQQIEIFGVTFASIEELIAAFSSVASIMESVKGHISK